MATKKKPTSEELQAFQEATIANRPPDLIKQIVELGTEQLKLEEDKRDLEKKLKDNNIAIEVIRGGPGMEGKLPAAMQEAQMMEFRLENGATIQVSPNLQTPSMAKDSPFREPVIKWLDEKGHGDAVKTALTIFFIKGDERVKPVVEFLDKLKLSYEQLSTVHPATLKALVGELLENGEDVPMEDLGISVFRQSKVK